MIHEQRIERAQATLRRLAVLSDRDPAYLPLFEWWAGQADRIASEVKARASAAGMARSIRIEAELEEMLS